MFATYQVQFMQQIGYMRYIIYGINMCVCVCVENISICNYIIYITNRYTHMCVCIYYIFGSHCINSFIS